MQTHYAFLPALIFTLAIGTLTSARGQTQTSHTVDGSVTSTPISAGKVVGVSTKDAIMVLAVGATGHIISFSGMDRVPITTSSGQAATLSAVDVGMAVNVYYVNKGGRLYISRAVIPDAPAQKGPPNLTRSQRRAAMAEGRVPNSY